MRKATLWMVAVAVLVTCGTASATGKRYQSTIFHPAFSVVLPKGWTVAERDESGAQMWKECASCPSEGEEHGEVTLDMALTDLSLRQASKLLQQSATGIAAGPIRPVTIGSLHGLGFTARRTGPVSFPQSGYHTEAKGAPLRLIVVRGGGKTVTIYIDPAGAPKPPSFITDATTLLKTLHFQK
jgi:hypothetical protein